jgi:outer membrane protein assembly factor BamB/orotate phosphoribosyltransferase
LFEADGSEMSGPPAPDGSVTPLGTPGKAASRANCEPGQLQSLQTRIAKRCLVRDEKGTLLAPDGKRQNWLFDLRKAFLDPVSLTIAAEQFWELFKARLPFQVGGLELAAVPLVSAIQIEGLRRGSYVNGFIVRRERKNYGLMKLYEGDLTDDPIIVVDDTFNSATSAERVRLVLAEHGRTIRDLFVIIDYQNPAGRHWTVRNNVQLSSLFNLQQFGVYQGKPRMTAAPRAKFSAAWHFAESGGHYFDVSPGSSPCLDESRIYYGSDDGNLWALNKRTGAAEWRFRVDGSGVRRIRSSPIIHERKIYFGSFAGVVHCVTATEGGELWRYDGGDWIESSPCLATKLGMLFIGLEHALPGRGGSLLALRMADGSKIWEFSTESRLRASPAYDRRSDRLACGTEGGDLLLFDPVARELLWRVKLDAHIRPAVAFDHDRNAVLTATMGGSIYSVDLSTGKIGWSASTDGAVYATPLVVADRVFLPSTDKYLHVFDAKDGRLLKRIPTYGKVLATPRLFNGSIYFGASSGIIYEVSPTSCAVTGQLQLPERITDALAFDDATGVFYARSYDGKLYAFTRHAAQAYVT